MEYRLSKGKNTVLNTKIADLLSPLACRETLARFWDEQLRVEKTNDGLLLALPLLYPDGIQVSIAIKSISPSQAILTDLGQTIARLECSGIDLKLQKNEEILQDKLKVFELIQNGLELQKPIRLPLDGIDVHLFAEALVSIAHLIYRHELAVPRAQHVYNAFRNLLVEQKYDFLELDQAYIAGDVEQIIRVDFLIRERHTIACKTVERRGRMREYMEQWGYRWVDAKNHNKKLSRAMFYDPDNQQWDEESLRIGQNVCEVFLPYFETSGIIKALERANN
jgi:hypothetical protein